MKGHFLLNYFPLRIDFFQMQRLNTDTAGLVGDFQSDFRFCSVFRKRFGEQLHLKMAEGISHFLFYTGRHIPDAVKEFCGKGFIKEFGNGVFVVTVESILCIPGGFTRGGGNAGGGDRLCG